MTILPPGTVKDTPARRSAEQIHARPALAYAASVALVIAAAGLRAAFTPWIGPAEIPFLTFFPAVFASALVLGRGPTYLAIALSAVIVDYYFIAPAGTFMLLQPVAIVGLAMFIGMGIGLSELGERARAARTRAEAQAAENERLRLLAEEAAAQAEEEAARAEEETARAEEETARAEANGVRATRLAEEREHLTADVSRERERLAAIVDQLPVGLIIRSVHEGRLVLANPAVERLLGRALPSDISPAAMAAFEFSRPDGTPIHGDDLPITRVLRTGAPVNEEVHVTRADGRRIVLHMQVGPIRDRDGDVTAGVMTMVDITQRRQTEEALRFLSEASAALGSSLDYEATLATVARLAVPLLADWCAVDIAEPDGRLRRIAISHVDPAREAAAWELSRRFPPNPDEDGPYAVLRTGQSAHVPDITPTMIQSASKDADYVRILREMELTSYVGVPIVAHGQIFGVLSLLISGSGRSLGEADLRLAEALGQRAGVAVDNARRHQMAVESVNMLDAVLAASPVGQAFVDRELRYVHVNATLAALHGVPVEDHLDRRIRDVLPAWADSLESIHREVFATERPLLDRRITVPAPRGGHYDLLVSCFPVRDAAGEVRWVGVTKADITERAKAELALQASEARLRRVVESPLIGIGFYDARGTITAANESLANLLGYSREELAAGVLRWDADLTAPEYLELDRRAAHEIETTGVSAPYEQEFVRRDGTRVPVLVGATRLDDDAKTRVFYALDLTERRRVEAQAEAAQRLEAVGRLAGGVAHEINNALQGVLGFNAFVIRGLGVDHRSYDDAVRVQQSAERAARIAQQLLAYSRRQVLQQTDLDLSQLLRDFDPVLRQALGPERELRLDELPPDAHVHADRAQLEQVLLNITLNARDAMPAGGVLTFGLGVRKLADRQGAGGTALGPGDYVLLRATDTGTGMDAETHARAFEPFFTTKPVGEGTGLGLSVVHGIVQQSGGQVWVESEAGQGTTVGIVLPRVAGFAAVRPGSTSTPSHMTIGAGPRGDERVLVADDDSMVLEFVTSLLRDAGYAAVGARDGREAIAVFEAARTTGKSVDLVLTDLIMPGMGGRELGEALAAMAPDVPILYTSGYTGDEVAYRGLIAEGAAFVSKPFAPEELLQRIRGMLDRGSRRL